MKNKKVLVMMSVYNGEKFIADQIISILNQKINYQVDILIRDDGSVDKTQQIIEYFTKKYPSRIKSFYGDNIGYNRSFFELIQRANGYDFYSLSDQDDIWCEDKIQVAIDCLEKENIDIPLLYGCSSFLVYDDLVPFGETQKQIREITFYNTIIQNILPGHEQVMNNKLLNELKKEIDYSKIYVYDSWITNVAIIIGKVIFNNDSYVYYRQHQSNEIGYGKGKIGWLKERLRRINDAAHKNYARQIRYFVSVYKESFTADYIEEMEAFLDSNTFLKRFKYISKTKLYRQDNVQTIFFKVLFLFGGYNK